MSLNENYLTFAPMWGTHKIVLKTFMGLKKDVSFYYTSTLLFFIFI